MRPAPRYVRTMKRIGSLARRYGIEALVLAVAVESALEVSLRRGSADAPESSLWFAAPAAAAIVLPLLARRRLPFAAPLAVWLLAALCSFVDGRLVVFVSGLSAAGWAAALLLGNRSSHIEARSGLAAVLGCSAIIVYNDPAHAAGQLVFIPLLFGLGWLAGYAVRARAAEARAAELRAVQAERERVAAARIAVAEERSRIARELHDIVAHAVSVMVLQVGAVRHKLPDELGEDRDALTRVEQAGRMALAEMRRLLAAMRDDGDEAELGPQPGLESVRSLVDEVEGAGLPVSVHVEGDAFPLPRAIELSAYRIVQEALTNALKHAHATKADVTLRYDPSELQLEVRDDGAGSSATDGLGHGLVGIRERVKIYGGEMSAGPLNGGGFMLRARLPVVAERE
jgi:signal transduction histidine kinase